jgi:SAM-dependent methyltransferase
MSDTGATRTLPTREGYDRWAALYDRDGNPLVLLEERTIPALLGDVQGLTVADIGCGTGRHAVMLAASGANVTALDFSDGMLAAAAGKPGADRVRWVRHDIARPLPLPDRAFDLVLCCLVLDHIEDVAGLFGELGRICHGSILVTVMHPAMMLRGVQARFTDPASGEVVHPRSVPNQISDYVMGAARAGLRIEHMSEHAADEALVRATPRAEKHLGWPLLLVMKMRPA